MALGKKSTAAEALAGIDLHGKRAIVTGATAGIGTETARALAAAGAEVTMAVRQPALAESLIAGWKGTLRAAKLDLGDLDSVRAFVAADGDAPVDILICNAGVMAPPLTFTAQGFESQIGINHVGHALLVQLLLPRLTRSSAARIVMVSSEVHRRGRGDRVLAALGDDKKFEKHKYVPYDGYGDSKLANVLFARALAQRLPKNVQVYSLHPGVIANTSLTRSMPGIVQSLYKLASPLVGKSVEQGAATSVWAATAKELEGKSGAYLNDCAVAAASPEGQDDALAEKVWASTEAALR
jgi:NAD(P)-dependent dehydrogenase (short-subunit alcohol dehydrogenase family)